MHEGKHGILDDVENIDDIFGTKSKKNKGKHDHDHEDDEKKKHRKHGKICGLC